MASYGAQKRLNLHGLDGQVDDKTVAKADVSLADIARGVRSPGVARIEAIAASLTMTDRIIIFTSTFILAYAYGLDGGLRYNYQTYATNSFGKHSLLSTINVVRAVIAAAAQPTGGKLADIFGRVELLIFSVFCYTIGTIIEAASKDIGTFCAGSVIYQIGYTLVILLVEVIVADITTSRARLFFSYIPALPFIINAWITGDIQASATKNITWNWGIGMWAIIYPVCSLPLIISLTWVGIRDKVRELGLFGYLRHSFRSPVANTSGSNIFVRFFKFSSELFWALDGIGIVLVIAVFGLILAPLTLAGGSAGGTPPKWGSAGIIAPLVVGVCCIPIFALWELRAPVPLVPFRYMKDRSVWAPIGIAVFLNFAWTMQADFLFTVLQVAFDFSVKSTSRIALLYSFVSVIVGTCLGAIVFKVRRLKPFIIAGTCLFMVAFGLLIHFRGSVTADSAARAGVIGAQVVLGFAGGLFPYTTQASLQIQVPHEKMAVLTGIFLAMYNVGSALGYSVAGAMWTQLLPGELEERFASINATMAQEAYGSPLTFIVSYPIGTPERTALISGYQHIQRLLTITGISLCVPLIIFSLLVRNVYLTNDQSLVKDSDVSSDEEVGTEDIATERK
ncbi:siderochrome-iron transporter (Sit1), putative [Cordyceps militaris CM01]|uniref:Siderochrome-iron transporter (Sit1), putative n=1 Tax=Cordyceps militaris (strain CM01) TaxID=983644 RepID=G3JSE1_CORMM|nr:siderochrome-iron transporter (Sit1), putative [Cordyceps militaris CM01]EGX88733.1 siderochrome-iron transporter (Sit1), putative [Cordyceps militaris CM01]